MLLKIVQIVLPVLGGGLAGALIREWYERKHSRLQRIPLIERVNRLVSTDLEGITLARRFGGHNSDATQLEEVTSLREYQMTLRNTSNLHLRDVEIQFEFPDGDVLARVQRPTLSKTALVPIAVDATEPWKKAFRWRIPHLPSGDSVEFTFQAIGVASDAYEVALYNSDRVIVEKIEGEPLEPRKWVSSGFPTVLSLVIAVGTLVLVSYGLYTALYPDFETKHTHLMASGCTLDISSDITRYKSDVGSVWRVENRIYNEGDQACSVDSKDLDLPNHPLTIKRGDHEAWDKNFSSRPKLGSSEILVGPNSSNLRKVVVEFYH